MRIENDLYILVRITGQNQDMDRLREIVDIIEGKKTSTQISKRVVLQFIFAVILSFKFNEYIITDPMTWVVQMFASQKLYLLILEIVGQYSILDYLVEYFKDKIKRR